MKSLEEKKKKKPCCSQCGNKRRKLKWFIIADDLERPVPFCAPCKKTFDLELLVALFDRDGE